MSHRTIQTLRRNSARWAYVISRVSLLAALLCFVGMVALPEPLRVWPVRGFFLGLILGLIAWATHYAFIVLDSFMRRQYGTALFMAALITGFGWLIQSCVRGMIIYR